MEEAHPQAASVEPQQNHPVGRSPSIGLAAVALAAVLWAVAATTARSLFEDGVAPLELSQARAYLAFLGFALLRIARRRPVRRGRLPVTRMLLLGGSIAAVNAAYYIAIEHLAVAVAIVMQYTAPALVVGWASLQRRALPSPDILASVALALIGVALAAGVGAGDLAAPSVVGLVAAGASAVLFSGYTMLSQRAGEVLGPAEAMFRAFGVASVLWVVFQAPQGFPLALIESSNLPRVLFVGLAGTLAPFLLYVWGIGRIRAERAVIAASLEPPAAAAVAWLWLGQALTVSQMLGGLLTLAAVGLLQTRLKGPRGTPDL